MSDLVKHIEGVCEKSPEGGTFCIDNADAVLAYYRKKGTKFTEQTDIPDPPGNIVVVKFTVNEPDGALMRHGFALVRDKGQWYRADSWQGMHPFVAKPIDMAEWLATWHRFKDAMASGQFNREQLVALFGDWPAEKEALQSAGEWVNDYPRTRTGTFTVKLTTWSA